MHIDRHGTIEGVEIDLRLVFAAASEPNVELPQARRVIPQLPTRDICGIVARLATDKTIVE
jgi:hypothetical protein